MPDVSTFYTDSDEEFTRRTLTFPMYRKRTEGTTKIWEKITDENTGEMVIQKHGGRYRFKDSYLPSFIGPEALITGTGSYALTSGDYTTEKDAYLAQ